MSKDDKSQRNAAFRKKSALSFKFWRLNHLRLNNNFFFNLQNDNDNEVYCGGYGVQHDQNGGRCGICGDPWDAFPR
jgi:hypothetical protein